MTVWLMSLMLTLVPRSSIEWTFWDTAVAIDQAAHESPLYPGEDGVERTAAELVAVGFYESRFDPSAIASDWAGFSYGVWQIHESNFARLGLTWRTAGEPLPAARAAVKLLAESHRICRGRRPEERLSEFASGRGRCDVPEALRDSVRKTTLAARLLAEHPAFWVGPLEARL